MTSAELEQRNMAMREYKSHGHTNKEVAEKFGLHKDTVKVICRGVSPQYRGGRKRIPDELCAQIRNYYASGNSGAKTAEIFGISETSVRKICTDIKRPKDERYIKALELIKCGYTAQEIKEILNYKDTQSIYTLARKHGLKCKKAYTNRHEEMREYKAQGHTMGEVAEKFGVTQGTAQNICKGIAPQKARPPKNGYHSVNKGVLQDIDNVIRIINERAPDFEYAGNYTGSDGSVDLRCKKCGHIRTANWNNLRHKGTKTCPNCLEIEKQKREAEAKSLLEANKLQSERNKRGKEVVRLLTRVVKLHRCPVCGTITDKKYCSTKCCQKVTEARKDANRRKKIKNALIDKDINLERLYNRDNGVCAICGGKCDWSDHQYRGRYFIAGKNYPSIDHIIPLSRGGEHSWDNVQLAHFACNSAKGASLCEQLHT